MRFTARPAEKRDGERRQFLLEMDGGLAVAGMMALPMCRRDIGDYLGLTLETVSRAFSQLHGMGTRVVWRAPDCARQS